MNRDDHEYKETPSVLLGNANADGAANRGWFIGQFLEAKYGLRSTPVIEVKWGETPSWRRKISMGAKREGNNPLCSLQRKGPYQISPTRMPSIT